MALTKDQCKITLDSETVKADGQSKHRPVLHVLMSDGRTTEFRHMAVAIPEAPASEAENQVYWLAVDGNGQPFTDENGNFIVRESPALSLGRLTPSPDSFVSLKEISLWTGLSESTIEREVERKHLTPPIRLSKRRNVYRFGDVQAWMEKRRQSR